MIANKKKNKTFRKERESNQSEISCFRNHQFREQNERYLYILTCSVCELSKQTNKQKILKRDVDPFALIECY